METKNQIADPLGALLTWLRVQGGMPADVFAGVCAVQVAEVERLRQEPHWQTVAEERAATIDTLEAERDTERAMRIERDGLLAAERQRFTAAYDAAQKLVRERDEARAEAERWREEACRLGGLNARHVGEIKQLHATLADERARYQALDER